MAAARDAQPAWAAAGIRERLLVLKRARHLVAERADELVEAAEESLSRRPGETLTAEIVPLADAIKFLERRAARLLAPRRLGRRGRPAWLTGLRSKVRREPHGVVLILAPSNYPLLLPGVQALQALAAGNAVLVKPAPRRGRAMSALAAVLGEAGLEPALFQVLPDTVKAGQAALAAGPDKVVLTGSAHTGRAVLSALADQVIPATVELSGCDAVFVREDADIEAVTQALAFGLTLNEGATCISPRRVFVPAPTADELIEKLTAALSAVPACEFGPAVTRVAGPLLKEAIDQGARLAAGRLEPPRLFGPLVVANALPSMRLLQEDVFAPVLSVVAVADDANALKADAQCPYALGATVFGEESGARALAERVDAGVVVVNDMIVPTADPRAPFGGRRLSGYGVTRGAEGLLEMTRTKVILVRRGTWRPHYGPPDEATAELAQRYLEAAHGRGWWPRLGATAGMMRAMLGLRRRR
jgi:acyl-CoA reductase-like NAD-dependent aldehyde dehydrogenase